MQGYFFPSTVPAELEPITMFCHDSKFGIFDIVIPTLANHASIRFSPRFAPKARRGGFMTHIEHPEKGSPVPLASTIQLSAYSYSY